MHPIQSTPNLHTTVKVKNEELAKETMAENTLEPSENEPEISELEKKIIRQIEYYFGDFNLSRDNFLRGKLKEDDGWIPLAILLTFNRMKALSTDSEVVITALKKSKSNLMEISEDKSKVRRNVANPLPENTEERKMEVLSRSIYAKGFPLTVTLDQLLAFFKVHGIVDNIQMRRKLDKTFKGSVFAIFDTKEAAEKFTKDDTIKFEGSDLIREMRADYHSRKLNERAKKKEEALLKRGDHAKKQIEHKQLKFERGCVLHITGLNETTSREDFKSCFEPHGTIAWVDYVKGDPDAWVRFTEPKAESVLGTVTEAGGGKLEIKGIEVVAKVVEGEEEDKYWEKTFKAKENGRQKRKDSMRGRGRGRGGRGRGRGGRFKKGRKRDESDGEENDDEDGNVDEPPAKQAKVEAKEEAD